MSSQNVYIVSAKRTPIGVLNGALASLPAHRLGAIVVKECLKEAMEYPPGDVNEVRSSAPLFGR